MLTDDQLKEIAMIAYEKIYPKGTILFKEETPLRSFTCCSRVISIWFQRLVVKERVANALSGFPSIASHSFQKSSNVSGIRVMPFFAKMSLWVHPAWQCNSTRPSSPSLTLRLGRSSSWRRQRAVCGEQSLAHNRRAVN
jgi:hypothetical protein